MHYFFTLILTLSSLTIFNWIPSGLAQGGTNVTGIIAQDATWTKANSPYTLTGPVAVAEGINLTIEPGVTVHFNSQYIQVNGTLKAKGTNSENIVFENPNGVIVFNPSSGVWNEQTQTGCIIENAVVGCYLQIYGSPKIFNDTIHCGVYVKQGSPIISQNTFSDFYYGLSVDGHDGTVAVTDNVFSGIGDVGIYISDQNSIAVTIQRNLLIDCRQGAIMVCSNATIRDNTIVNNMNGGIIVRTPFATITYNNIENNHPNLSNWISSNITVPNNWWGTTEIQAINQTIYDYKNDFNLGTVTFVPILNSPNPQAPSADLAPTPSPSPTSTLVTPTPILSSTPESNSPTPSPSVPEFPISAILALLIVLILIATLLLGKGRKQT